ncbi:hypothetical protein [Micromonospora sp. NPDC049301]|uniref:hypothetical protein n=1 Tax=Micromonospora sp. NPDC049301 TaxID=3155723 RepID=UPI003449ADA1
MYEINRPAAASRPARGRAPGQQFGAWTVTTGSVGLTRDWQAAEGSQSSPVLEQASRPTSMVLSSWIRIVGDVWLVGTHPQIR